MVYPAFDPLRHRLGPTAGNRPTVSALLAEECPIGPLQALRRGDGVKGQALAPVCGKHGKTVYFPTLWGV